MKKNDTQKIKHPDVRRGVFGGLGRTRTDMTLRPRHFKCRAYTISPLAHFLFSIQ